MNKPNNIKPVQHKYNNVLWSLRRHRPNKNKEKEVEIAHLINRIETYGFDFFPNHYVYHDVIALEKLVASL